MQRTAYLAGKVQRWHTVPSVPPQTIADHAHGVLALILLHHPEPSLNLLKAAAFHDHSEYVTGDIPAPIKRDHPELREMIKKIENEVFPTIGLDIPDLTEEEALWLKWADVEEAYLYVLLIAKADYTNSGHWRKLCEQRNELRFKLNLGRLS